MNQKNPTNREKQEHEDYGHAVYRSWCAAVLKVVVLEATSSWTVGGRRKRTNNPNGTFWFRFPNRGECACGTREQRWWAGGCSTCGRTWRLHHRRTSTKRMEWKTSKLAKEDQRQQVKNNRTSWGRQYDLSKKLRTHQHLPIHMLLWNIEQRVRHKVGWVPYSCRSQVMLRMPALDAFQEKDGRKSRYIGEVWDWYRGEDAGDLKKSEINELVENWTSLVQCKTQTSLWIQQARCLSQSWCRWVWQTKGNHWSWDTSTSGTVERDSTSDFH